LRASLLGVELESHSRPVPVRLQRFPPQLIGGLLLLAGAGGGLLAAAVSHGVDPFVAFVVGMTATVVAVSCVSLLDPASILTGGLLLSVFSGYWGDMHIPIPVDRVVVFAGIGAALFKSWRDPEVPSIRLRPLHWLMLLLILYAFASAAWSGSLTHHAPLFALIDRLGLVPFLLYLVAPIAFHTSQQRRTLVVGLLILGAYLGLTTLFEAVHLKALVVPKYILNPALGIHADRARGPFLEAGANGLALFACLVAAAITFPSWRDRRMKGVVIGVILLCTAGILFTLTRQTWVAAGLGAVAAMLVHRRLRSWLPLAAVAATVVVVGSLAFVPGLSASFHQRASDQASVWDRLNSDAAAERMVLARPALGFGWGQFGTASPPYYRLAATYPLTAVGEAHNVPLSNAAELGLVGALLWLGILIVGLGDPAIRRLPPALEPWRVGLIAVAVAWFVQSNFTPLDYAFDNYIVWLLAGVVLAARSTRASPAPPSRPTHFAARHPAVPNGRPTNRAGQRISRRRDPDHVASDAVTAYPAPPAARHS
jgi:putative inorganic carbon (HCO3(-)) transporter